MAGPFYFAYAGGAIVDQVTLATNGTTHGGRLATTILVGDTGPASGMQLINIASVSGLEEGALYAITGAGVDALAIYDNTVLSGLPDSLNLDRPAASETQSEQHIATKAVSIGSVIATFAAGSGTVSLDAGDLPAGRYAIYGPAIGETNVPVSTTEGTSTTGGGGFTVITTAFLDYDGVGSGSMGVLAATPRTVIGDDEFGSEVRTTGYSVALQQVRALYSGNAPAVLLGFPVRDPASITGIPSSALASLEPGLVYNISGNGIQIGTTFVAPSSGTEITIDLNATASDIDAILTITGPRTPNAGTFDPAIYNRFDEEIVSLEIAQEEGGFATLTVEIRNPGVGLLAIGRYLWAWLSWDRGFASGGPPDLVPLFNGRLVGVPKLQAGEIVSLEFLARPDDLNAQKSTLADSLRVLPYYDPVWLAANTATLDTVLEAYSSLWHMDRTNLSVTTSDVLAGEDGTIDIGEDVSLYERFSLTYGQPPLVATTVTGTVTWQQQGEGMLDITQQIVTAFYNAGSAYRYKFGTKAWGRGGGGLIQVLSGNGLKSDWPKPGTNIGAGWSLRQGADYDGIPWCYIIDATSQQGGWIRPTYYNVIYEGMSPPAAPAREETSNIDTYLRPFGTFSASFPLNVYKVRMWLDWKADRKRTETISAVVMAGVQQQLSDNAESDREMISLTSEFVGQAVDADFNLPIGDVAYRSYFQTERGARSFEYLLLTARAKMRARARSVDIAFAVPWANALDITLRHSVQLTDRRLPGGVAVGKVKSYRLSLTNGVMLGEFTIGCSIGTGDGTMPQAGLPSYVDDGYTDDYQAISGIQIPLAASDGDMAYETLDDFAVLDDGVDLSNPTADSMINKCQVTNGMIDQMKKLRPYQRSKYPQNGNPIKQTISTTVNLDLKPLTGTEFQTNFYPAVTPLVLPMTIDLSAPVPGA